MPRLPVCGYTSMMLFRGAARLAFLAAEDQPPVTMAHLIEATRREHHKTGRRYWNPNVIRSITNCGR